MDGSGHRSGTFAAAPDYDAVIVGASLAGCTAALLLGRSGARVALVEQRPDPAAFKRMCSHYIQASGVPTLERLGLLETLTAAGAVRSPARIWTRWGWIVPPPNARVGTSLNLRRERLDPLLRDAAAQTPGVELLLGRSAERLLATDGRIEGVVVRDRKGHETQLRGRLVIGADGRGSRIAELAGVKTQTTPHERFAYGAYFEGPGPVGAPATSVWMLDPHWAAAFPTDAGLTFYACMPTKARLPEFREDPAAAIVRFISDLPEAPPIRAARQVGAVTGKIEMPNTMRVPTAPGLALVGDAALAIDPLWGVGCGWALQSGEWLAEAVAPALAGTEPLDAALARYRKRWTRALRGHARVIHDYANGRRFNAGERFVFSAAVHDDRIATQMDAFGTRTISPGQALARTIPRAVAVHARRQLRRGNETPPDGASRIAVEA
jgi:menaquinone-9 beta-reductase